MKLIFLNRYFHPDHSATSQMLSDLAFALAQDRAGVTVISSRQRYDDPDVRLPARETIGVVDIHRVWTSRFGRHNLVGRAVDYATFYLSAAWRLWRLARRGDVVVAKTDPPMLSIVAAPIARLRRAKLVNWLQDVFPEVAQQLGILQGRASAPAYRALRWLRDRSLKRSAMNVVLGERMEQRLRALGVAPERLRLIPNFADGNLLTPQEHGTNGLRPAWGLADAFVVAYSGNLGRAHEYATLLDAVSRLEAQATKPEQQTSTAIGVPDIDAHMPRIVWLFIGGGVSYEELKDAVARRGLKSVRFEPYQPRERLAESLSAADVHIVSLRPELEGLIVPSKFYGIAAAGRPTIFIGDANGEIAQLIGRHRCGRVVPTNDGAMLAQIVLELAADTPSCRAMGKRARQAFEAEFDKAVAVQRWEALLSELTKQA